MGLNGSTQTPKTSAGGDDPIFGATERRYDWTHGR
jgi:hypothetical protein